MRFVAFVEEWLSLVSECECSHFDRMPHRLKSAGLKSTPGRRAVLETLEKISRPLSPEEIHQRVGLKTCDRATVYRILDSLLKTGLIQQILVRGKKLFLSEATTHHHHHAVCRQCGATVCLDQCLIAPLEKEARSLGFRDLQHSIQLTGLCRKCCKNRTERG
ncbi:MAG: transcriptional repressor [Verrucomicrobia bacterium]|nr:transcriptional repressor [Verrucomicrobiota bacterium]